MFPCMELVKVQYLETCYPNPLHRNEESYVKN